MMKRKKYIFLLMLITVIADLYAASGNNISGRVVDEDLLPIADAQVVVQKLMSTTFTNSAGIFLVENLPTGKYRLEIHFLGYQPFYTDVQVPLPEDSLLVIKMEPANFHLQETTVTTSRLELENKKMAFPVTIVGGEEMTERIPESSAELLMGETGVSVQKTNHGGGSAIIRGLSSNQILILIDGIRLNNSTYRLGNHQYLTTIDPLQLSRLEVIRGPGSASFGSDALGGVINAVTQPLTTSNFLYWKTGISAGFSSADMSKKGHGSFRFSNRHYAFNLGLSYNDFGDLKRGNFLSVPQLEKSKSGIIQKPSAFRSGSLNFKGMYKYKNSRLIYAYQMNRQYDVPRYDKYENDNYYLWTYQPQERQLAYIRLKQVLDSSWLNKVEATISYQLQREGRNFQLTELSNKTVEKDEVGSLGLTALGIGAWGDHLFTFGLDIYRDLIRSRRTIFTADDGSTVQTRGRFPNQGRYRSQGLFFEDQWHINSRTNFNIAARYSSFAAEIPTDTVTFPQDFNAATFHLGFVFELNSGLFWDLGFRQGFRAPNMSDLGKLGESKGETYEIPNLRLQPEKLSGFDTGFKFKSDHFQNEFFVYYSKLSGLISSAPASLDGNDQIETNGRLLYIRSKQNIGSGFITGVEWGWDYVFVPNMFSFYGNLNWTYGQNMTQKEPLNSIPPVNGKLALRYHTDMFDLSIFTRFASTQKRLSEDDKMDPRIAEGGTGGWTTLNAFVRTRIKDNINVFLGIENILDQNYREHGSGINAPGINVQVNLSWQFSASQ